eukprot:COSAG02_NODE_10339_length_1965_cov_1.080386_1_plen_544_part_10
MCVEYEKFIRSFRGPAALQGKHYKPDLWERAGPRPWQMDIGALRGLPKVHKAPCGFRPVVDQRDVITCHASCIVDKAIQTIISEIETHETLGPYSDNIDANIPRNRERLLRAKQDLVTAGFRATDLQFVSGDFEAMYPSIDCDRALRALVSLIVRTGRDFSSTLTISMRTSSPRTTNPHTGKTLPTPTSTQQIKISAAELLHLTKAVLQYSPFSIELGTNTLMILQNNGVIMGVNLAPSFANAYALEAKLILSELHKLQRLNDPPSRRALRARCNTLNIPPPIPYTHPAELRNTLRQIDDVAFLATPSFLQAGGLEFLALFYERVLGLTITWTKPDNNNWTPWLDTYQRVCPATGEIQQKLYSKPGNTFSYPHADSYIPASTHTGVLVGGLKRLDNNCTTHSDRDQEVLNFLARLRNLGHQPNTMHRAVQRAVRKRARRTANPTNTTATAATSDEPQSNPVTHISIDYDARIRVGATQHAIARSSQSSNAVRLAIRTHRQVSTLLPRPARRRGAGREHFRPQSGPLQRAWEAAARMGSSPPPPN